jgi:cysteine-rich repeat protein
MSIARRAEERYLWMGLALMCGLSGCLESRTTRCGELYCPEGTTCASGLNRCVPPAHLAACQGLEDGASCALSEGSAAQCVEGVCLAVTCGDGLVMLDEVCDDGNTHSCDGCSADCRSTEQCGNGLVECAEQCDDGPRNAAAPNANCRLGCRRQRCGDGVVDDLSGEDCDGAPPAALDCHAFGYYGGALGCSTACRSDVAGCVGRCGDGVADVAELCDGAPPEGQSCLDFGYDVGNVYCGRLCTPTFNTCGRLGFSPMSYSGGGVYLYGAWGSSPSDIFAAGFAGSMLHYDGTSWAPMETGVDVSLYGVGGTGPNDVWAVGREGTLLHYDGGSWAAQASGTDVQLFAVWAYGPRDIFVGGRVETLPDGGEASVMLYSRGDGTWTKQRLPVRDGGEPYGIFSIWGSSPSDVFAVGAGEVVHFDGGSWSFMSIPEHIRENNRYLNSVWGSGPKDVFTVGELGLVLHYDGQTWTPMEAGVATLLNAVDGTGPNDVYAVGDEGVALHYNGTRWASLSSNSSLNLVGLSVKADQAIAVGTGTLTRFERGGPVASVITTGMTGAITGIWSDGPSNVVAASDEGEIFQFNGKTWSSVFTAEASLWSVWASGPNDIFVVGRYGTIVHYGGPTKGWTTMDSTAPEVLLNWVWGSGPNDVYAVGSEGTLLRYDGSSWTSISTGTTADLYGVWGSGASDVYVVGTGGTVLHRDGSAWSTLQTGTTVDFWAVWGADANEVLLFADLDGVYRLDGSTAVPTTVRSLQSFTFGSGTSPTNVFSVEYQGQGLSHFDGVDWASLRIPPKTLYSVFAKGNLAYVGASGGEILEVEQLCASRERHCSDRWDDDCDGLLNCADPDCAQASSCAAGGLCQPVDTLSCNSATSGSTAGGSPMLERYGCVPWVEAGRERAHRFVAPASGKVTIELSSSAALDVIIIGALASGACDPQGMCLGSTPRQGGARQVTFDAVVGETYWVMVDGPAAAIGPYGLQVSCP